MSQYGPEYIWSKEVQDVLDNPKRKTTKTVKVGDHEKAIPSPFPSPEDWRDAAPIYQIMIDRFNNPDALPKKKWNASTREKFTLDKKTNLFQGGTFEGIRQQLGYLQELGIKSIWLSPIQKNSQYNKYSYHGYGIQDFLSVEPQFASNKQDPEGELQALIDEAHARGIYVIFDIVLNHAGNLFSYVDEKGETHDNMNYRAENDPYDIRWHNGDGKSNIEWKDAPLNYDRNAAIWPKELCRNDFFRRRGTREETEHGGDFFDLKEFVTSEQEIRNILIRIHQYLIAKFDIDGFRIDTLRYVEPEFSRIFGNAMREFALSIGKKTFFTFGEIWYGNTRENEEKIIPYLGVQDDLVGVDAALDFPLFSLLPNALKGLGNVSPKDIANMYKQRKELHQGIISSHGEVSKLFVTFLDNHDLNQRFYSGEPYEEQAILGITCLFALQGIPCLYYGTEQELHGYKDPKADLKDLVVRQALWGKPGGGFNMENPFYQQIKELSSIRAAHPALRYGRQYFRPISGDETNFGISTYSPGVLAFSRILNDSEVVVVANTHTEQSQTISVIVDYDLNDSDRLKAISGESSVSRVPEYCVKFSNTRSLDEYAKISYEVEDKSEVSVTQVDGSISGGSIRTVKVTLQPMEVQILVK